MPRLAPRAYSRNLSKRYLRHKLNISCVRTSSMEGPKARPRPRPRTERNLMRHTRHEAAGAPTFSRRILSLCLSLELRKAASQRESNVRSLHSIMKLRHDKKSGGGDEPRPSKAPLSPSVVMSPSTYLGSRSMRRVCSLTGFDLRNMQPTRYSTLDREVPTNKPMIIAENAVCL